ncbi:MAG TPA: indole-3-glycerol-phosphate synthase [Steroidobacteraceae bacterium]|nr:indole-3-glycerol-phosphate synthase [Steroidobacteraceae bacterium]
MSGLLTEMARLSYERFEAARAQEPEASLWPRATAAPAAPKLKLSAEGFDLIAECKLHSPSMGDLSANTTDVESRVAAYGMGGAAIVSVLTEPSRFGGQLTHLEQASKVLAPLNVPTMRKDFLVEPYQVMEARVHGAGGVLVIARMLDQSRIKSLLDCAAMLNMFVLIEAFDADDMNVINEVLASRKDRKENIMVGINSRDLQTLKINFDRFDELVDLLPTNYPKVAESGVNNADDVRRIVQRGFNVALVGTTLMSSADSRAAASELLVAGREAALARMKGET